MGTVLHSRGIRFDDCFDELNIEKPDIVMDVHRAYIDAGSQMVQTNTFGANRFKLAQFGLENRVKEINKAGVNLLKNVCKEYEKEIIIAGDVGPLGVRFAPFGRVQLDEARDAFREQISVLIDMNVDLILIETMTDFFEVKEAIMAAREINPEIPVLASMTFTRDDRTLLGDSPEKVALNIYNAGADIIGINCSGGPLQLLRILKKMRTAVPEGVFSVMPNAGWPEQQDGRIMYPAGPEYFGEYALAFWQAGARILGGCCGTTPEHIASMAKNIQEMDPKDILVGLEFPLVNEQVEKLTNTEQSELSKKLDQKKFIISVEMDPPRGTQYKKTISRCQFIGGFRC